MPVGEVSMENGKMGMEIQKSCCESGKGNALIKWKLTLKLSVPGALATCNLLFLCYRTAVTEDCDQYHCESSPQNSVPAQGSDSEWSRVSSTNSLEWDNVQNSLHASPPISDIDTDTQLLLCEIERLTTQTLSETGLDLESWFTEKK